VLRPTTTNIFGHIQAYDSVPDKAPYVRRARQVVELVDGLPHPVADPGYELARHHARQVVSFYEHFTLPDADALVYREGRAAENLRWWHDQHGGKIAYWAASPHTANAPTLRLAAPPDPDMRFPSAGSHLRGWYGQRYRSIGFTFDQGSVALGRGQTVSLSEPAQDWMERPFGAVGVEQFTLDLTDAPPAARPWLDAPTRTRGLPDRGPGAYTDGGTPAQWFDVIVHRQDVTPVEPISP
jgi:erythromycin esterase